MRVAALSGSGWPASSQAVIAAMVAGGGKVRGPLGSWRACNASEAADLHGEFLVVEGKGSD
ncbi:MAG: hypothetical protein H7269_04040 [Cellulomonas sp.]|nr:hypothetical protein [Cellulomonas sp.]